MPWTRRYEEAEPQRVNRWLAQNGICSRREAEALIGEGRILIDGVRVEDVGRKILPGQILVVQEFGSGSETKLTIALHKPVGIVSAQPEKGQVPAARLLTADALLGESPVIPNRSTRLAPLGRLDMDSRGLLLLSEDGVLAKAIIGPESELEKEYLVGVAGAVTEKKLALLRHGLRLDGRALKPAHVTRTGAQELRFILKEGRNRQIRRMCDLVDLVVLDLLRTRIGPVRLDGLPEARWRVLSAQEHSAILGAQRRP